MTETTNRIEKRRLKRGTSLETLVDRTAVVLLVIGIVVSCGFFLNFSIWGLSNGIAVLIGAFVQWLLLRCLAEHLRLQKRIAGLAFEGRISGPDEEVIFACGNCGQMLHSDTHCESCGFQIVAKND